MSLKKMMLAALLVALGIAVHAEGKTIKVLSVGNSFSGNAQAFIRQIAAAAGDRVVAANAYIGGCDMARHMSHVDAFEANPNDPKGRPYAGKSLKDLLIQDKWDYVTIQQSSPKSFKPETYHPHAERLIAYIKKYAPQAEIVIHQTWAYRDDHSFFGDKTLNTDVMYQRLRDAYYGLAKDTGCRVIPCGDAMQLARQDPAWGKVVTDPACDPKTAVYPTLPAEERSLHCSYSWGKNPKTGEFKLGADLFHANGNGQYLLGCVWYEFLFGKSVVGNTFVPKGVTAADAAILQSVAHRVVTEKQRPTVAP